MGAVDSFQSQNHERAADKMNLVPVAWYCPSCKVVNQRKQGEVSTPPGFRRARYRNICWCSNGKGRSEPGYQKKWIRIYIKREELK